MLHYNQVAKEGGEMMLNEAEIAAILPCWKQLQWYYSIELSPGSYTKGFDFPSLAITRRMVRNLDSVEGRRVLDYSTMEGVISTIMAKRGARVLATDVIDVSRQVALVQTAHGARFSYYPSMPMRHFAERVFEIQASSTFNLTLDEEIGPAEITDYGHDIVVSSGVLYHVFNPIDHLLTYRKLCKLGGLLLLETAVALSDEISFFHVIRPEQTLYGGIATWFVTTAFLDLFLRACFFEPLAFCYLGRAKYESIEIARIGIIARAVGRRPFDARRYTELSTTEVFRNQDFRGLRAATLMTGRVSAAVEFSMDGLCPIQGGIPKAIFNNIAPLTYSQDDLRLSLGAYHR